MKSAWLLPRPRSVTRPPATQQLLSFSSCAVPSHQPHTTNNPQHNTQQPRPQFKDAWEELGASLTSLPPTQPAPGELPLRHRRRVELEARWAKWAQVTLEAHHHLSGRLSGSKRKFESSVVRVVAHTMRLSLLLGRWRDAQQLERAFFSTNDPDQLDDYYQHTISNQNSTSPTTSPELRPQKPFHSLSGLGLRRGVIRQAWLSSLALALRQDAQPTLAQFLDLLVELRKHTHASGAAGVSPHVLASLARLSDQIASRMVEEGVVKEAQAKQTVAQMLHNLGGGDATVQDESVLKALAEVDLTHLEGVQRLGHKTWPRWRSLTQLAQRLMQKLDETHAIHSAADDLLGHVQTQEEAKAIEGRAETLHIAIRFLLLQARLASDGENDSRAAGDRLPSAAQSLASALSLYSTLVNLIPRVSAFPAQLVQLRTKQSATLYRLMWASIGTFDINNAPEVTQHEFEHGDAPRLSIQSFNDVHLLLETSLATLRPRPTPPPTPATHSTTTSAKVWPMAISSTCFRRLLYCHTLPAAPSRRKGRSKDAAVRPPWSSLHRTLSLVLDVKRHDIACASQVPSTPASLKHKLLNRSSILINLFRAALLGGSDPSLPGEGSPESRLYLLLEWLSELDNLPGEAVDRTECKKMLRTVLTKELVGDVWVERKEGLMGMVGRWAMGLSPLSLAGQQRVEPDMTRPLLPLSPPWEHDTPPHQPLPLPFSVPAPPSPQSASPESHNSDV